MTDNEYGCAECAAQERERVDLTRLEMCFSPSTSLSAKVSARTRAKPLAGHKHLMAGGIIPEELLRALHGFLETLNERDIQERVEVVNTIREVIASYSPFEAEPVDFVRWVKADTVAPNNYNPNSVAPPEMELLRTSILSDGYTQPIVANLEGETHIVIDGFHRNRVGRECNDVKDRVHGYLPVVQILGERTDEPDRMASTIRHNRARGKHQVELMSEIVIDLKRRNWSDKKIGLELGMDQDEVLRLAQISGLAEAFRDEEFSEAWEAEGSEK